jgi:hypothetical protein
MAILPGDEESMADRYAITDVLSRYVRAVDGKDEQLLSSCFTDAMQCQGSAVGPMQLLFDTRPGYDAGMSLTNAEFAAMVMRSMRLKGATQHDLSSLTFEFPDRDHASCTAYLRAIHFALDRPTAAPYEVGGVYRHDLVREPGESGESGGSGTGESREWKIAYWRLAITWEFGDFAVMSSAIGR